MKKPLAAVACFQAALLLSPLLANAQTPDAPTPTPATPAPIPARPAADQSGSGFAHWYVGTGIGAGLDARARINGQTQTFDDQLQGATDKSGRLALNLINAGIALGPQTLLGFHGSLVAQTGKLAGDDVSVQINNYFAALTHYPWESGWQRGFFIRAGGGYSNFLQKTGSGTDRTNGFGVLVGGGYALHIAGHHYVTFTLDHTEQFYRGSGTKPDNSQFTAAYLGYLYRH